MSQQLVKSDLGTFNRFIKNDKTIQHIESALGEKSQDFISNCLAIVSTNDKLAECDPVTVMNCILKATTLDLSMQLGHSWAVPYNDNKTGKVVAQFQIGTKGLKQLAIRTGAVIYLNVAEIKEGEPQIGNPLTGEITFNWIKDLDKRSEAKTVGKAAYIELKNGFKKMLYMTIEEIHAHAKKYSKSYGSSYAPWQKETSKMEDKTIMKQLLNGGEIPLSITDKSGLGDAIKADQAVLEGDASTPRYIDNPNNNQQVDQDKVEKAKKVFNSDAAEDAELVPEETTQEESKESIPAPPE